MSNFIEGSNFMSSAFGNKLNFMPIVTDFNTYRNIKLSEIVGLKISDVINLKMKDIIKEKIENER